MKAKFPLTLNDLCYRTLYDGEVVFLESIALKYLVSENLVDFEHSNNPDLLESDIGLIVNCNDLFGWATADAEPLRWDDIEELYRICRDTPHRYGPEVWACRKRNVQPIRSVIRRMKELGVWTEELEVLPNNKE